MLEMGEQEPGGLMQGMGVGSWGFSRAYEAVSGPPSPLSSKVIRRLNMASQSSQECKTKSHHASSGPDLAPA